MAAVVMQNERRYAEDPALAEAWDESMAREALDKEAARRACFSADVYEALVEGDEPAARKLADLLSQAAREQSDPDYATAQKRVLAVSMLDSILEAVREEIRGQIGRAA